MGLQQTIRSGDLGAAIQRFNADHSGDAFVALFAGRVRLKRTGGTLGGEWHGPCPLCGGTDRFMAWPHHPDGARAWCRNCGANGDALRWAVRLSGADPDKRGETARFLDGITGVQRAASPSFRAT